MHDEENDQGLDLDTGAHVEDARGYDPKESEDGPLDKIKNAFGGDTDEPEDTVDEDLHGDSTVQTDAEDDEVL